MILNFTRPAVIAKQLTPKDPLVKKHKLSYLSSSTNKPPTQDLGLSLLKWIGITLFIIGFIGVLLASN